jgi:hypothetical protein
MKKTWIERQSISLSIAVCSVLLLAIGSRTVAAQNEFEIEPGLKIPNAKTPWAVDVFENQRQLVPLHYAGAFDRRMAGNTKVTTELARPNSVNQLHFDKPVLYFWLDRRGNVSDGYDFFISRVEQEKERRVIDRLAFTQLTPNAERRESFVETETETETETTAMRDGWMRIEPRAPMPEGEYVLLAIPKVQNRDASPVIWPAFGIHANAPNAKDVIAAASEIKENQQTRMWVASRAASP